MLEAPPQETTTNKPSSSLLFAFVPRQVTLAKHQNMKKEELSETPTVEPTKKDKSKKKKKKKNKGLDPSPLLLSIAAYLQHQGFTNTLAAFQSEASIGQLDESKVHGLDLEMFYKYLETSTCDSKSDKNVPEELGMLCLQNAGVVEEGQEKSKSTADTALTDKTAPESQLYDSKEKSKDKKRKKSKLIAVENDGNETCTLEGKSVAEKSSTETQSNEENVKPKNKKKKNKSLESALKKDTKESDQTEICKIDSTKESNLASEDHTDGTDKKSSKKRKRMVSEGNESQPDVDIRTNGPRKENAALEDDTVSKDKKSSKKRKKMTTGGNESQPDDDENKAVPLSQDDEVTGNGCMVEDRNTEGSKKLHETSIDEKVGVFSVGKNTPKGSETPINGVFHPNGDLEKNGTGTGSRKSTKKQQNGSSEPKSANAFQRVKIDEVVFADDRLQDNSYWAKSGAEVGYGAKAQEVLGQVRGRDFRHEKTKKKRGSYRGGQIDLQTHSIKFNYSDEE